MFWFWFVLFTIIIWFAKDQKSKKKNDPQTSPKPANPLWANVIALIVISPITAIIAVFVTSCTSGNDSGTSVNNTSFSQSDALALCQYALKRTSRDPDKADIPYVDAGGSGNEYYFSWGQSTKMIRMRNGLGIDVATSASCIVNKTTKAISQLTLDGKTIL